MQTHPRPTLLVMTAMSTASVVSPTAGHDDWSGRGGADVADVGSGTDVLYLPISRPAAEALGVTILGFESIVFTPGNLAGLAECG